MKRFDPCGGAYRIKRKIAICPYKIGNEGRFLEILYIAQCFRWSIANGYQWRDERFATRKEYKRFRKAATFEKPWVTADVYGQKVKGR